MGDFDSWASGHSRLVWAGRLLDLDDIEVEDSIVSDVRD